MNTLKFIGSENVSSTKDKISKALFQYNSFIKTNITYTEFSRKLWSTTFDPLDPDNGWYSGNYKSLTPLTGENVNIVPIGSKGYLLDSTYNNFSIENGNVISYTLVKEHKVDDYDGLHASIYCFVSKNYNGDGAGIYLEGSSYGKRIQEYDLNNKGVWQKISIIGRCRKGTVPFSIFFKKNRAKNLLTLRGRVIFAYPQSEITKREFVFNPKDPDSGWGWRVHKKIFPLTGKNVDIVPSGSIGYLMDSTCDGEFNVDHVTAFSLINNQKVENKNIVKASVYCFVSNDFNGSEAGIYSEGTTFGEKEKKYNFKNKGVWQILSITANCNTGKAPVYLYFSKQGVNSFSTLKGHIIFAFPQYNILSNNDSILTKVCTAERILQIQQLCLLEKPIPLNQSKIKNNTTKSPIKIDFSNHTKYIISSLNLLPFYYKQEDNLSISDTDPLRNWIAKFISEDTTYYPYKKNIVVDTISNAFTDQRLVRWQFAWQIFKKEYSINQKIFGGGFSFLNWYGYYFLKDKTKTDYPHNPFLYILLYSGIVGVLLYILLLYKVFYYYIKYIKEYYLFFIFFLITYFFTFFSGGNPFDPPIMGFFMMLPFFIHYIHQKDKSEDKTDGVKHLKGKE